jgi:hypothetical protein
MLAVVILVLARSDADEAIQNHGGKSGLLRGACHRARIRAALWLAMTVLNHRRAIRHTSVDTELS